MIQITLRHGASPSEERIQRPERPQRANRPPESVSPLQSFIVRTNTILQNVGRRDELPRPNAPVQDESYNRSISPLFANQSTLVSSDANNHIHRDIANSTQHPCELYSSASSTTRPQVIDLEFSEIQQSVPSSSDINSLHLRPPLNNSSTATANVTSPPVTSHLQQHQTLAQTSSSSTSSAPVEPNELQLRNLIWGLLRPRGDDPRLMTDRISPRRAIQRPTRSLQNSFVRSPILRRYSSDNEDDGPPVDRRERANLRLSSRDRSRSPTSHQEHQEDDSHLIVNPHHFILPRRYLHRRFPRTEHNSSNEPSVPIPPLINLVEGDDDQENTISNNNLGNNISNPDHISNMQWYNQSAMMIGIPRVDNAETVERTLEGNDTVTENSGSVQVIDENLDEDDVELDEDADEDMGTSGEVAEQEIILSEDLEEDNDVLMSVPSENRLQQCSAPASALSNNSSCSHNNTTNSTSSGRSSSSSTIQASNNRMDVRQLVLSALECPVCFDYVSPPVTQCTEGHLVCNRCRKRLNDCPECRGRFSNVRPRAVEKIASLLEYPCSYEGCTEYMAPSYRSIHAKTCSFRSFLCPISPENCSWSGFKTALHNHIVNFHGRHLHWIDGQKLTFVIRSQVGNERVYVMDAINNLFHVKFIVAPQDKLRGCVTLLGSDATRAENINVAVLVHSSDRPSPCLMVNRTPAEENDEMDMRLEKFAVFDISQFTQSNSSSSLIRVRIAIGKKDILKQLDSIFE